MTTLGHTPLKTQISKLLADNRLPQSMLLYGQSGIGKKRVAMGLASHLCCKNRPAPSELKGCGVCHSCGLISQNAHPDVLFYAPTPPKQKGAEPPPSAPHAGETGANWTIKIEQLCELKAKTRFYPLMAKHQLVIIDEAEKMTTATANSLLKILEEPRPHQVFILITSRLHQILPTIRSRCSKFAFSPLSKENVLTIIKDNLSNLANIKPESVSAVLALFPGSAALALKALQSDFEWQSLAGLMAKKPRLIQVSGFIKTLIASETDLTLFLQGLRQQMLNQNATNPCDRGSLAFFDRITAAERALKQHIQKEFVIENLFL